MTYLAMREQEDAEEKNRNSDIVRLRMPKVYAYIALAGSLFFGLCIAVMALEYYYPDLLGFIEFTGNDEAWVYIVFGMFLLLGMSLIFSWKRWYIEINKKEDYFLYRSFFRTYKIYYSDLQSFREINTTYGFKIRSRVKNVEGSLDCINYETLKHMLIRHKVPFDSSLARHTHINEETKESYVLLRDSGLIIAAICFLLSVIMCVICELVNPGFDMGQPVLFWTGIALAMVSAAFMIYAALRWKMEIYSSYIVFRSSFKTRRISFSEIRYFRRTDDFFVIRTPHKRIWGETAIKNYDYLERALLRHGVKMVKGLHRSKKSIRNRRN